MPDNFFTNLGSNLGTQFGEALGASLFGGSAGDSNPEAIFNPWNVNNMGTSTHFNPTSRTYGVNYSTAENDAYNSLFGIAQNNFNEAGTANPYQIGQQYYDRIRAMQQPGEARRLADLRDNLFATGRLGLGMGPNAANPELAAYYQSLFEQDNALAGQSLLAGQDIVDRTLARGRGALEGAQSISGRGLDMIKLGGILGTYGRVNPAGGGGGLFGLGASVGAGLGAGPLNGAQATSGGGFSGMPVVGGGMSGSIPFSGSSGNVGPIGPGTLTEGGTIVGGGDIVNAFPGSTSGAATDVLGNFGLEGGTASGNFVDGLLGPLDETANFFGDGLSAIGGLFGEGSAPAVPPIGSENFGMGGGTTNSPTIDNSASVDTLAGSLFGNDPYAGGVGSVVASVLSGDVALSQLAAQDLTSIAQAMPPDMGRAFADAVAAGDVGYAEQILRAITNHYASSGGGAGFGWSDVGIDRGLDIASGGSAGNMGLNLGLARGRPIYG